MCISGHALHLHAPFRHDLIRAGTKKWAWLRFSWHLEVFSSPHTLSKVEATVKIKTILFLVVAAGLVWWFWVRTFEPVEVIRAQLEAMNQRDFTRAYTYLSPSTRETLSLDVFQQEIQAHPQILNTYDSVFLWRKIGKDWAAIEGTLESADLRQTRVRYVMEKRDPKWFIREFQWQDVMPPKPP
jgi:hypothetical protein